MDKFVSLLESHPELAEEADGWDPSTIATYSSKKLRWKCPQSHLYFALVSNRTSRKSSCPFCSGNKVLTGFNDLATKYPDLAKEAVGWNPKEVTWGSGKKLEWRCALGHVWEVSPNQRTSTGSGCPYCSHNKVWVGYNDLSTLYPLIASESSGWNPSMYSSRSNKKLQWKCRQNHTWSSSPASRIRGDGCPFCSGKKVLPGFNDLATTYPEIAREAYGWDPSQVQKGSNKSRDWKCQIGHIWKASTNSRTNMSSGCSICSNLVVLKGFNDLATTHPHIASEADGWDPTKYISSGKKKMPWRCLTNDHRWLQRISERKSGTGCPSCAQTGFDPNKNAYVYLLRNPEKSVLQIGISGNMKKRMKSHYRNGFEVLDIRGPMKGILAFELEQDILRFLDRKTILRGKAVFVNEFDGYTESWLESDFKVQSVYDLINIIDEDNA